MNETIEKQFTIGAANVISFIVYLIVFVIMCKFYISFIRFLMFITQPDIPYSSLFTSSSDAFKSAFENIDGNGGRRDSYGETFWPKFKQILLKYHPIATFVSILRKGSRNKSGIPWRVVLTYIGILTYILLTLSMGFGMVLSAGSQASLITNKTLWTMLFSIFITIVYFLTSMGFAYYINHKV